MSAGLPAVQEDASTRDRIIDATLALFNAEGIEATSIVKIAKRAGIMPGNLTYYFPKKRDIILEIESRFDGAISVLQSGILARFLSQGGAASADEVAVLVIQLHRILWKYRFCYTSIMALTQVDNEIRKRFTYISQKAQNGLARLLQRAIDNGEIQVTRYPNSVSLMAENLWTISWGTIYFQQINSENMNPPENEVVHACATRYAAFIEPQVGRQYSMAFCNAVDRECLG